MFEHRLGLVLGKSVGEVRALPYPEYRSWQIFYLLEPWGFENDEIRAASLLAQIHNVNVSKRSDLQKPAAYMRDTQAEVLKRLQAPPDISKMTREELLAQIKKDFGVK